MSTTSIYHHLPSCFWTSRSCSFCSHIFTLQDYQTHNYQLTFLEVLKSQTNILEVKVQLTHLTCPCLVCQEDNNFIKLNGQRT